MSKKSKVKYAVLGTGSSGNSYVIQYEESIYVIDQGFSLTEFKKRLKIVGFEYSQIKAIFLTHSHGDHKKGAEKLALDLDIPIFCNNLINLKNSKPLESGKSYKYQDAHFYTFPLSHDSVGAMSYYFNIGGLRLTLITDTGQLSSPMYQLALNSDIVFLESNYDVDMLDKSDYQDFLKNRIKSIKGHLSNNDAVEFMNDLIDVEDCLVERFYLIHVSKRVNCPDILSNHLAYNFNGDISMIKICEHGLKYSHKELL